MLRSYFTELSFVPILLNYASFLLYGTMLRSYSSELCFVPILLNYALFLFY